MLDGDMAICVGWAGSRQSLRFGGWLERRIAVAVRVLAASRRIEKWGVAPAKRLVVAASRQLAELLT